jgi:beta-lactamase regulating signal transducer with metallopeptidase domain
MMALCAWSDLTNSFASALHDLVHSLAVGDQIIITLCASLQALMFFEPFKAVPAFKFKQNGGKCE